MDTIYCERNRTAPFTVHRRMYDNRIKGLVFGEVVAGVDLIRT